LEVNAMKAANVVSRGDAVVRWWRSRSTTRALLWSGIVAAGLYVLGDVTSGLIYNADKPYSFIDQWISELTAIGSPVRPMMVGVVVAHDLLLVAFGIGVLRVAGSSRSLRWAAGILIGASAAGLSIHTAFPMSSRWLQGGVTDVLHGATSFAWSMCIIAVVVLAGVGYRGWFRIYSIATAVVMTAFGAASAIAMRSVEQNDTPFAGAFERINAYALMAWFIVLAVLSLRRIRPERRPVDSLAPEIAVSARTHASVGKG
jgi:hypothetical protein